MVWTLLTALVAGTIIGMLGKAFAPGKRDIALWLTVLCGIGGVFLGNWLYVGVFDFRENTNGIDWWRHLWQIAVAAVLVVVVTSTAARRGTKA